MTSGNAAPGFPGLAGAAPTGLSPVVPSAAGIPDPPQRMVSLPELATLTGRDLPTLQRWSRIGRLPVDAAARFDLHRLGTVHVGAALPKGSATLWETGGAVQTLRPELT